jgi:protocatechuate 3,4-dioxygenase beta subunit
MLLKSVVLAALVAAFAIAPAPAQDKRNFDTNTRSVKGSVLERNGKPVPGAVVLLKDSKTLQVRSFVTQDDGAYRFYGLSTNNEYELRAQHKGSSSNSKILSAFDNRKEATIDLKLK